ncbi:hypothetical protein FV226_15595 [Methylobacterium sp. WL12]|uniref:hypothetical protein n=1 Tax=Methylobacterium sp. WL12 TaxID=2603890 RepID=UPI0011C9A1DC|nr:hypothetical protein [Methylobacterium sp. WL12]TXM71368.1 hypothetical protein FV226_15595 [Methylobacterium sp. WL12]
MQKEAAMRLYAIAATERKFERIHRIIFGSQLNAFVRANMLGGRISLPDLKDMFLATVQQYPKAYEEFGFDSWLKFLLDVDLLTSSADVGGIPYYARTEFAKAYMHYIISLQLPPRDL